MSAPTTQIADLNGLLTASDVAAMLNVDEDQVRKLAASGLLLGIRMHGRGRGGRTWRFTPTDVAAYLDACRPSTAEVVPVAVDDGHARRRRAPQRRPLAS